MKTNEALSNILQLILDRQLGKAINSLENYLLTFPRQADMDNLITLRNDYQLMVEYWQRGFDDPKREQVYDRLLRRLYVLTANMAGFWQISESAFLKATHLRPRKIRKDWSMTSVKAELEAFVGNVAMLQLESNESRRQKSEQLHNEHWLLMRDLFDYILTSRQWRESLADAFVEILLSPTLASNDQQLIVSAITISALQNFCIRKFMVLTKVYQQATDEQVRQRALVGWVLNANSHYACLFTEMAEKIKDMCQNEKTREELAELQMQLICCLDADSDTHTIQKEILPDIISGSNLKITRHGLVEMDDDSIDDILHPEASEMAVERMEQSMKRMADMQKQGSDIYFGGFSQMKRFQFFNDIPNWFVPFYPQHPSISQIWQNTKGKKFLKTITKLGAFCDSDKYSFVLAFEQVLGHLPPNILKMIESGEASAIPMGGEIEIEDQGKPTFIRRIYLQNLYRFYRLYTMRSEFHNPFTTTPDSGLLFFASPLFGIETLQPQAMSMARFLMKRHRFGEAVKVMANIPKEKHDLQYYVTMGTALQHTPDNLQYSATDCFRKALLLQPDNERALAGLARALFNSQNYEEALEAYRQLLTHKPDHRAYQLNMAICMIHVNKADEALKLLYKLNYINADDLDVCRVMAWALTIDGKYEQADKLYCRLLAIEKPQAADMLNYGYCLWFARNVVTAIGMFRQLKNSNHDQSFSLENEFMNNEHAMISHHGITDAEIRLMLDAVE